VDSQRAGAFPSQVGGEGISTKSKNLSENYGNVNLESEIAHPSGCAQGVGEDTSQ
jgi:hypothetical protein